MATMNKPDSHATDSHSVDSHSTDRKHGNDAVDAADAADLSSANSQGHNTDAIGDKATAADATDAAGTDAATTPGAQTDADEHTDSTAGFSERSAQEPKADTAVAGSSTQQKRTRESAHLRRSRQRRRGAFFWLELLFFAIIFLSAAYITVGKAMEGSYGWLAFGIIALVFGVGGLVFRFTRPARFDGPVENSPEEESELVELITSGKRVDAARKLRQWNPGLTLAGAVGEIQRIEQQQGIANR